MSKRVPYLVELALGLVITGFIAWNYASRSPFLESFSLKTYDLLSAHRPHPAPSSDIRIVEIDDNAVSRLGRWPWPRALQAQLIDELVGGGAKVIGLNVLYADPDQNQGFEEITELQKGFNALLVKNQILFKRKGIRTADFDKFREEMSNTAFNLNGDALLARSIEEAGNVVLPMYFEPGDALGNNLEKLPEFFDGEQIRLKDSSALTKAPSGQAAITPLQVFGKSAVATGHSNLGPDSDGSLRRIAPVIRYGKAFFPSFGLQIVREYLSLQRDAYALRPGLGFALQKAILPMDSDARTFIEFAGPAGTFAHFSAVDVLSGGLPEGALNKKIVLVGVTATGNGEVFTGPGGERYTGLEIWANHIENILTQTFVSRPSWSSFFEWGSIALAGLVVIVVLPFLKARISIPVAAISALGVTVASSFFFIQKGLWASPTYSLAILVCGFATIISKRLLFTERGKELVEAEGVETNKMLGLSFQGQGMLDLAFEKFRRCPLDTSLKEILYNLGLDMERKRMFAKAAAVYEHVATVDPKYKDIRQKIEILKKASEGAVFGGIGKKGSDATVVVDGLGQFTTLGRYEVVKELGRGAMGIVYLGKDPKINRAVAIKTLRFEEEMDAEQTHAIKERFFREAESAGNLTHPNIIRIFDAGEDQEVAYIAMELLDGEDLKKYFDKASLLPISRSVEVVAQIAQALDYAHKQGVVHRDIKPGNLMLLRDGTLRITDFGIARIQAVSKTATGAVLGTPAYMSPEQVNGKKVDGRADIFSLGVTLYELLTGEKPFQAESIAALLYRIANVDHADPRDYNSKIPLSLVTVLSRALAKDPAHRYQTAGEMARDLRAILQSMESGESGQAPRVETAPPPMDVTQKAPVAVIPEPIMAPAPTPAAAESAPSLSVETPAAPAASKPVETPTGPTLDGDFMSDLQKAFNVKSGPVPPTKPLENTMVDDRTQPFFESPFAEIKKTDDVARIDGLEQNSENQSKSNGEGS